MRGVILGLALAALVLGGVIVMRGGVAERAPAPEAKPEGTVTTTRRHAPDVVLAIKPGVPAAARASAAQPKRSALMVEFESRKGRKALYDRLSGLGSRSAEETYLLAEIMNDCKRLISGRPPGVTREAAHAAGRARMEETISQKDPTRDKRLAAYEAVSTAPRACEGFQGVSINPAEIRALMARAAEQGDPRARARLVEMDVWAPMLGPDGNLDMRMGTQEMKLPKISDEQLEAIRQAAASNDPAVLAVAGRLLASTMADLQIRAGPEERPVDPRTFLDAWMLAACDAGGDCGPGHPLIAGGCISFGNCDARDLREYLFYYAHSPQQSQQLAEYQVQIARAIQSGNWSYFQFHRGPVQNNMIMAHPPP